METALLNPTKSLPASIVRWAASLIALLLLVTLSCVGDERHRQRDEHRNRPPRVPAGLEVPAGHELASHASAAGVQIYVWTQSAVNPALYSWVLKAPHAVLIHHEDDILGIHYAGPTWQGNDGSKVVGRRLASSVVKSNAIPWLLLQAASNDGIGVFADTTYIQRLDTEGGLASSTPGSYAGQEALVPYVANYYFYHAR